MVTVPFKEMAKARLSGANSKDIYGMARDEAANAGFMQGAILFAVATVVVLLFLPIVTSNVATAQADANTSASVSSLLDIVPILFVVGVIGTGVAFMVINFKNGKK